MKPWNPSEDAILKSNYGREGVKAQAIAAVLGRSRNSVIGRADKLGLSKPSPKLKGRTKMRFKRFGDTPFEWAKDAAE